MKRYLKVRTKNFTASVLKNVIETGNKRVVLRLGSTTPTEKIFKGIPIEEVQEINTAESCKVSGDKLLMKMAFDGSSIKTAPWSDLGTVMDLIDGEHEWKHFPAIIKHYNSSKGKGIFYINNKQELLNFIAKRTSNSYIIEKYLPYVKEYRLHVTHEGCFYTCRKMLKHDAVERWHRHDNNSVWILEENPLFDKPSNWDNIVAESIRAIKAVGLDMGAVDVKVQSSDYKDPKFIILETNSAPSLGEITKIKYLEILKTFIHGN